jgi:uncharacterized protein YjbI with pentapeptide repeats
MKRTGQTSAIRSGDALEPPRLSDGTQFVPLSEQALSAESRYSSLLLAGLDLADGNAPHLIVTQAILDAVSGVRADWEKIQLDDARASDCDFSAANWSGAALRRVEIGDCRMVGLNLCESVLEDVLFRDCSLRLAQLYHATLRGVRFERCDLREAYLGEADLRGVVFRDCNLSKADLTDARLREADLRGSIIDGARFAGAENVRGAVVDLVQAAYLASLDSLLGVVVRDGP